MSQLPTTVCILDAHHGASPHYASWRERLTAPSMVVDVFDESWEPSAEIGVVVTLQHYMLPNVRILRRLVQRNEVPVLIVADGILEYRNTWTRTDFPAGNIFQPVLGHKFACVGRSQARILESWGNVGKCEIVGLPRTDPLRGRSPQIRNPADPVTILVMTAKTPGFNEEQHRAALQSLRDLRDWVAAENRDALRYRPMWRLTGNLADELEIPAEARDSIARDLGQSLAEADIVVTTPSTAALEGMLCGIPVALLDYTNSPHFVDAAWTITAPQHIPEVIPDLVKRTPARMLWQDTILHDSLECESDAAHRMARLVEELLKCCQESKAAGRPLALPERILPVPSAGLHSPEPRFDFPALYPHHAITGHYAEAALSLELGHAHLDRTRYLHAWRETLAELANVRRELSERDARLVQLHQEITQRDAEIIRQHDRVAQRDAQLIQLHQEANRRDVELARQQDRVAEQEAALVRQREETLRREAVITRQSDDLATRSAEIARLQGERAELEAASRVLEEQIAAGSATVSRLQKGKEEHRFALGRLQEELSSREEEITALRKDLSDLGRVAEELRQEVGALRPEVFELERQVREHQSALTESNAARSLAEQRMEAQRRDLEDQLTAYERAFPTRIAGLVKWPFRKFGSRA